MTRTTTTAIVAIPSTQAVAMVMLGLSVANVIGVPAATWLGQALGWRAAYWAVAVLALVTSPTYDPNDVASHDIEAAGKAYDRLAGREDRPLANRAAREI